MVKTIDSQWLKNELMDVQRWEDEGGQMIENNAPLPDRLLAPPVLISPGSHNRPLQWNARFAIEPFQPTNGIFWRRKNIQRRLADHKVSVHLPPK